MTTAVAERPAQTRTKVRRPTWRWSEPKERAAILCAEDALTDREIAAELGIGRRTLADWKEFAEFRERVTDLARRANTASLRTWIGKRQERVGRLLTQAERIERVVALRAEAALLDPSMPETAKTGLMVGRTILSARGDVERTDWTLDTGLCREYRATLEQAARELGQLSEKVEVSGDQITRRYVGVDVEAV